MRRIIFTIVFIGFQVGYSLDSNAMDLYNLLKEKQLENKEIVLTFKGELRKGSFSNKDYVFLEEVVFFGETDVKSTFYSPRCNENDFFLLYGHKKYSINFRTIRTFLSPSFSKLFKKTDAKNAPKLVLDILKNKSKQAMATEYGLKSNKKYFAIFTEESYLVNSPKGPQKKTSMVLYISDKHFKNGKAQVEITPLYSGWTY